MPAPLTKEECATWYCTAMKPPDDKPDTEVWLRSIFSLGKGTACAHSIKKNADTAASMEARRITTSWNKRHTQISESRASHNHALSRSALVKRPCKPN